MTAAPVSIVVPTLNEAATLPATLHRLLSDFPDAEVVVVDGGSTDGTPGLVRPPVRLVRTARGRGGQLNAGARAATADVLWFVHADTTVEPAALEQLQAALSEDRVVGGGLTLHFDRRSLGLDYLRWSSNQRARRLGWIFGDQAMFVRRDAFEAAGGFPDQVLMEDLELARRLLRIGELRVLRARCTASVRRFDAHGTWSLLLYMQYLKALYFAGVDPAAIARRYTSGPPWRRPFAVRRRREGPTRVAAS